MKKTAMTINFSVSGMPKLVESGWKTQTVRKRKILPDPEDWLRIVTGNRTPDYRVLFYAPCNACRPIEVRKNSLRFLDGFPHKITDEHNLKKFAQKDGFYGHSKAGPWQEFIQTIAKMYGVKIKSLSEDDIVLSGHLIHWDFNQIMNEKEWERNFA